MSTLDNECSSTSNNDLFKCMDYDVHENNPIDLPYVLDNYNKQYEWLTKTASN